MVITGAVAERDPGADDGSDRWDRRSARGEKTMRVRAEAGRARSAVLAGVGAQRWASAVGRKKLGRARDRPGKRGRGGDAGLASGVKRWAGGVADWAGLVSPFSYSFPLSISNSNSSLMNSNKFEFKP